MGGKDSSQQRIAGDRGQRRLFGGLPDHRVPAHERDGQVPRPDGGGEIEGGDDAYDAHRVPVLNELVTAPFRSHGPSVQLPGETDGEITDVDHLLDLSQRFGVDLSGLHRHQCRKRRFVSAQRIAKRPDDFSASRRRHVAPLLKRAPGRCDRFASFVSGVVSQGRRHLAVDRGVHRVFAGSQHACRNVERSKDLPCTLPRAQIRAGVRKTGGEIVR